MSNNENYEILGDFENIIIKKGEDQKWTWIFSNYSLEQKKNIFGKLIF